MRLARAGIYMRLLRIPCIYSIAGPNAIISVPRFAVQRRGDGIGRIVDTPSYLGRPDHSPSYWQSNSPGKTRRKPVAKALKRSKDSATLFTTCMSLRLQLESNFMVVIHNVLQMA